MQFYGDADIPMMFADFGVPVKIGAVEIAKGAIADLEDQAFATGDGDRGEVVIPITAILVQTSAFPDVQIDDVVLFDSKTYSVRERLRTHDGAITRILLGD